MIYCNASGGQTAGCFFVFFRNFVFSLTFIMIDMKHLFLSSICVIGTILAATASEPTGYYESCRGKSGNTLLKGLENVVSEHTRRTYAQLWTDFYSTDADENGRLIDMYSTKRWTSTSQQCGNYNKIGDCYNREHSFPKSWFGDDANSPMYTDLFHLYPTDGYVNNQRSNYPFGECANGTPVSSVGGVSPLGKLGNSTFSGYSGKVFEPDDCYKGDFARTYFYMIAAYNSQVADWDSDMLAGNAYPGFSTWAVNLLLKWHRADPVDDKETKRNEAIYKIQGNRNPFIDHPELAEHIWGTEKSTAWTPVTYDGQIATPVDGTVIDLGYVSTGVTRSFPVSVRTFGASSSVRVSVTGSGFSVSPSSITAANANAGTNVNVNVLRSAVGPASATLTVTSGNYRSTATLKVELVEGLGMTASQISAESFTLNWINLHGSDATYSLNVKDPSGNSVDGYPETVDAADERYVVTGLEPLTPYTATLSTRTGESYSINVTTAQAIPTINVILPTTDFESLPGEPSSIVEAVVETYYVNGNLTVSVGSPFELSTDKTSWTRSLTLFPEEDRFFVRLNSPDSGSFISSLTVSGEGAQWSETIVGSVGELAAIVEDFEAGEAHTSYDITSYQGSTFEWVGSAISHPKAEANSGDYSIRMNKNSAHLTMNEDYLNGASEIGFYAAKWDNNSDATAKVQLLYSIDGGKNWTVAKNFDISATLYNYYSASVDVRTPLRVKIEKTAGGRLKLDDFTILPGKKASNCTSIGADDADAWTAYCLDGKLIIESYGLAEPMSVYSLTGLTLWSGSPQKGLTSISLAPGLYIVATDSFARRVLVK